MKKNKFLLYILMGILVLSLTQAGISPVSAQNKEKLYISELDCSQFPTITLQMRGLDAEDKIITADSLINDFSLYENDQLVAENDIKPVGPKNGPMYVVFSFDLGKSSNLSQYSLEIKSALLMFANNFFNENVDTVRMVEHINDGVQEMQDIQYPTQALSDFETGIENLILKPSTKETTGYLGLENLYGSLSKLNPGRYSMAVIHFNRLVLGYTTPTESKQKAQSLGIQMASHNIRVFILNTFVPGWRMADPALNDLTYLTGGDILQFSDSTVRQAGVMQIYNNIKNNSQVYEIQLRAHAIQAKYSLVPKGGSLAEATDSLSCIVAPDLTKPVVVISQPKGENPVIYLQQDQKTIPVVAELQDWPQDGSRQVSLVELYDGQEKLSSKTISSDMVGTTFSFDLDVSDLVYTARYNLHVRVTDEFGLVGDSTTKLIEVNPYQAAQVQTPTTSTGGPFGQGTTSACQTSPFSFACIKDFLLANLVWFILGLFAIAIVVLFITNRKLVKMTSPAREVISNSFNQVRKTLLGGTSIRQEPIAILKVIAARPDRVGDKIEIYNTRTSLGRDPKVTDVQLYHVDEESSVSSLHCTIFYEQGKFFITDDNSTNGTYINGKRLEPNEPVELFHGTELILGDTSRHGAKLRFEIPSKAAAVSIPPIEEEPIVEAQPASETLSEIPRAEIDDSRETVPGYRQEYGSGSVTENFSEPPITPVRPGPDQAKSARSGKSDKKDWKDELS